jgi:hypothetical protein
LVGFSTAIKNQLSFNKMLETQLAQLAATTPAVDTRKIPGQLESTLESVNTVTARWGSLHGRHITLAILRSSHNQREDREVN